MNLTINTRDIQDAIPFQLLKAYTSTTEEGQSQLNLVVFSNSTDEQIMRDLLIDAIDNQYNYVNINRANDEITIYTFTAIKGYTYCID
ncbi:hypothetical protein [uncultured Pontibacter sp.]|uniref:hypothetical protein n=1 Tax=uncultured Pontibacter sp. TaxID=453356 RepID=UPI0026297CD2|nr:hypothetical protein [uncultured Pontibacter sp.]